MTQGFAGIDLLKPQQLFGLQGLDEISHCLFWSLFANIGLYIAISLLRRPDASEHGQAALFVDAYRQSPAAGSRFWRGSASIHDLLALLQRFLGPARAHDTLSEYARYRGANTIEQIPADADTVHHAESLLAGAIGNAGRIQFQTPPTLVNGVIGGLVAVTASCNVISPLSAVLRSP